MGSAGVHYCFILFVTGLVLSSPLLLLIPIQVGAQNNGNNTSTTENPQTTRVVIPNGAANPTVDLTLKNIGNWYTPKKVFVSVGDTVVWKNEDTEPHTVTSGLGGGIQSVQNNEKGKPDGIFDSGAFKSGESWSRTFYNPGTYNYFCTIHPWMEASVVVSQIQDSQIPAYPVDSLGNKQTVWPVHTFSKDGKYDIDLMWDPSPLLTGKTVTFFADFYIMPANVHPTPTPYDFVVLQNGKELDRVYALTEVGEGVHKYQFSKAGPVTIRIENVGDGKESYSEFNTLVYPNPNASSTSNSTSDITRISGGTQPVSRIINPLTLVWVAYGVIIGIPAAVGALVILFKKGII